MRTVCNISKLIIAFLFLSTYTGCGSSGGDSAPEPITTTTEHHIAFFNSCVSPCSTYQLYKHDFDNDTTTEVGAGIITEVEYDYGEDELINFTHDGKFYFSATDGTSGVEPWVYDYSLPEQAGVNPKMVMDISTGASHSNPYNFYAHDDKIYFNADTVAEGNELWVYDPSLSVASGQNPKMVYDVNTGGASFNPEEIVALDSKIYMKGYTSVTGTELFVYDPSVAASASNPQVVVDIRPGVTNSSISGLRAVGGKLYFSASNGTNGIEPWVYDPSVAISGTNPQMFFDVTSGSGSSTFRRQEIMGNNIYFKNNDATNGTELWALDTTQAAGVTNPAIVFDINSGVGSSSPHSFAVNNGKLYFSATGATSGEELFVFDPNVATSATNPSLLDINPGATGSNPYSIYSYGEGVLFSSWISSQGAFGYYDASQSFVPGTNPQSLDGADYADYIYDIRVLTYTTSVTE